MLAVRRLGIQSWWPSDTSTVKGVVGCVRVCREVGDATELKRRELVDHSPRLFVCSVCGCQVGMNWSIVRGA